MPFGSDPVFVQSSSLYNSALKASDYYTTDELNSLGVPFGFFPSPDDPYVFNVCIDINADQSRANATLTYLRDGFFLDAQTKTLTFEIVTYNANLRLFSSISVAMAFSTSGEIQARQCVVAQH